MTAWHDRHVLVAGARRTGVSVVDVLLHLGTRVTADDRHISRGRDE